MWAAAEAPCTIAKHMGKVHHMLLNVIPKRIGQPKKNYLVEVHAFFLHAVGSSEVVPCVGGDKDGEGQARAQHASVERKRNIPKQHNNANGLVP